MIDASAGVLAARKLQPDKTLAQAYEPRSMNDALVKAHTRLDRVVDKIMGAPRLLTSERQRQEYLFARYSELAS